MINLAIAYISTVPSRINLSTMAFRIFIDATQTKRYEIKKRIITMDLKHSVFSVRLEGLAVHG
jgi:hypothetical protein